MPGRAFATVALTLVVTGSMMYYDPTPYADGPPPGHTGGFGEPTCHQCHADRPGNDPRLLIAIAGLPEVHIAGEEYDLKMIVSHPEMKAGGFQVSARYNSGERAGQQAGRIALPHDRGQFGPVRTIADSAGVVYVSHASPIEGDSVAWSMLWTAPEADDPVIFHIAANASNHDDSEFGDRVGSVSFVSLPQRPVVPGDGDTDRSMGPAPTGTEGTLRSATGMTDD